MDKLTAEREKLESGQSARKQNFLWNHWGQKNQRGPWRTGGRNTAELPNCLLFTLREVSFFWDHEDMNTTFPLTQPSFQPVFCNVRTKLLYIKAYTGDVFFILILLLSENRSSKTKSHSAVPSIKQLAVPVLLKYIGVFSHQEKSAWYKEKKFIFKLHKLVLM